MRWRRVVAVSIAAATAIAVVGALPASADTVSGQGTSAGDAYRGGISADGGIYYASSVQVDRDPAGDVVAVRGAARVTKISKVTAIEVDRVAISKGTVLATANSTPANSGTASTVISYTNWIDVQPGSCLTYRVRANDSVRWSDGALSQLSYLSPLTRVCGPSAPPKYSNCAQLNAVFPHGIGLPGAIDSTSGKPVTDYYVSAYIYDANTSLDRDKDGIACEKA